MKPRPPFTNEELEFFQTPRSWPEIIKRFGRRALSSVLEADCDGGRGLLGWCKRTKRWGLHAHS